MAKGGFDDKYEKGAYVCAACKTKLYTSDMKFDCGCGWPGFWRHIDGAVDEHADADGRRVEVVCSNCKSHLGHVFRNEGFTNPPPNVRECVNSLSLAFVPEGSDVEVACTYSGPVYG